jgi:hypothetical protein
MRLIGLRGRARFPLVIAVAVLIGAGNGLLGVCGPLVDVAGDAFCPFVLEIFYLGITTGTSPTTYDPTSNVSRLQMAAFLSRTVDRALQRGSRRSALRQFWTPSAASLGLTTVGSSPHLVESDGLDLWVPNSGSDTVSRVRASAGKLLETWTGATNAYGALSAMNRVLVTGQDIPGLLYQIDPSQAAGVVTTVSSNLGNRPAGIAFDGSRIWTANLGDGTAGTGSVSIVTPGATIPWTRTNVSVGFNNLAGVLYDGANIWVTDGSAGTLLKLNANGAVLQTVTVGSEPLFPNFDGTNIWVPNAGSLSVSVVRASTGAVLATLTGNGLNTPTAAAFDGQRVLFTNILGSSVSLWKAADLTAIGSFSTGGGTQPFGACSDGVNFWITMPATNKLAKF